MPQLIVAVEFDAPYTKFDWVQRGYARSIQFVQVGPKEPCLMMKRFLAYHLARLSYSSGPWALNPIIQVSRIISTPVSSTPSLTRHSHIPSLPRCDGSNHEVFRTNPYQRYRLGKRRRFQSSDCKFLSPPKAIIFDHWAYHPIHHQLEWTGPGILSVTPRTTAHQAVKRLTRPNATQH